MRSFVLAFLFFNVVSCSDGSDAQPSSSKAFPKTASLTNPDASPSAPRKILEFYSDESHIGRPGRNKIEIEIVRLGDLRPHRADNFAIIRFYSLTSEKKWEMKQTIEIENYALAKADPQFLDFTGDDLKDVTFISGTAARGSNEVRTLLIYDNKEDKLIHIENSEEYPNIEYNKKLKCIDSWRVYGGTATDFARIEGSRIKTFATVENFGGYRTVTTFDGEGRERVLRRDKISDDDLYTRYRNFNPLEY